jgi:hypothetical protein
MISGRGKLGSKEVLLIGLLAEEAEWLLKAPLENMIGFTGKSVDLPEIDEFWVMVGTDQQAFLKVLQQGIDQNTKLRGMPDRLKN